MDPKIEKLIKGIQSNCAKAGDLMKEWDNVKGQLCEVLDGLMENIDFCIGDVQIMRLADSGVWGPLSDLPGCVEGCQLSLMNLIHKLIKTIPKLLTEMKQLSNSISDRLNYCLSSYQTLSSNDSALNAVFTITSVPLSDYLTALRTASRVYRLQHLANRTACAVIKSELDFENLKLNVRKSLEIVGNEDAIIPHELYPIHPECT